MRSTDFLTYSDLDTPQQAADYRPLQVYTEDAWFLDELDSIYDELTNSMSYMIWVRRHTTTRKVFLQLLKDLAYSELLMRLDREYLTLGH